MAQEQSGTSEGFEAHAEAEFTFLRSEEGGKNGPALPGYRPPLYYDGQHWMAFYEFAPEGPIEPGDTVGARICFLSPELQRGRLFPGKEIELREGSHLVARGHIIKLLALAEKQPE